MTTCTATKKAGRVGKTQPGNLYDDCIISDRLPAGNWVLGEPCSKREYALTYAALGFRVLPIRPADKRPLTIHGVKDATTDQEQIHRWWNRWPDANVGLAMGSSVVAIDVDPAKGGNESLAAMEAELGDLPATWTAITGGGGQHLLLRVPAKCIVRNKVSLRPGVDIRGDNGYIVVAPSDHSSGRVYEWGSIPGEAVAELPPEWLIALRPKGLGSSCRGRHVRGEKFAAGAEETDKRDIYAYLFPPSSVVGVSVATKQQIAAIFERETVKTPGARHAAILRVSAALNRLLEVRGKPAEFFEPLFYEWWEQARDGECAASWKETWADWSRLWDKSQDHDYRTPAETAFAAAMSKPLPAIAGEYGSLTMKELVAFCCEMQATCADENGAWYLSCRTAAILLGVLHPWANKCLQRLQYDGVIERAVEYVPGSMKAMRYRLVRCDDG